MTQKKSLLLFLLIPAAVLLFSVPLAAQITDGSIWMGTGFGLANPGMFTRSLSEIDFMGNIEIIVFKYIGFNINFVYMGKQFYYYDNGTASWVGPAVWGEVPYSGDSSEWIFYQEKFYFTLELCLYKQVNQILYTFAFGTAQVFYDASEAIANYPDYEDSYMEFLQHTDFSLGYIFRLGLEYLIPLNFEDSMLFSVGFNWIYENDSFKLPASFESFIDDSSFQIFIKMWFDLIN